MAGAHAAKDFEGPGTWDDVPAAARAAGFEELGTTLLDMHGHTNIVPAAAPCNSIDAFKQNGHAPPEANSSSKLDKCLVSLTQPQLEACNCRRGQHLSYTVQGGAQPAVTGRHSHTANLRARAGEKPSNHICTATTTSTGNNCSTWKASRPCHCCGAICNHPFSEKAQLIGTGLQPPSAGLLTDGPRTCIPWGLLDQKEEGLEGRAPGPVVEPMPACWMQEKQYLALAAETAPGRVAGDKVRSAQMMAL